VDPWKLAGRVRRIVHLSGKRVRAMLRSMTGFGAGRARVGSEEIAVELKSVNHKFCEVKLRLPRELAPAEPSIVRQVKDRVSRGAIEVWIKRQTAGGETNVPRLDVTLAKEYLEAFRELSSALAMDLNLRVQDIAAQPGVLRLEERAAPPEEASQALLSALESALSELLKMRAAEGAALKADLEQRLAFIEKLSEEIAALGPKVVAEYRQRLEQRLADLLATPGVEPQRIAQEVAIFADRTDVAEEMTRLSSHLSQFRVLISSPEPAGRKLDFLLQEMNREVNTTGSKSQHVEISSRIVALKAELERLREQVQNIE
jgi:uncharacterized protein (TIGR00255 family)